MASKGPWETVKQPVSVWNRNVTADFKELFKGLSKAVIGGAVQKWDTAAAGAVEAISAVKLEALKPGELAWLLIRRALTRAVWDLVGEVRDRLDAEPDADVLYERLGEALEQAEVSINREFFQHPERMDLLERFSGPFQEWLQAHGLKEAGARTVAERLPTYFIYALNQEWRDHPTHYARIETEWATPFSDAADREYGWNLYSAWLRKQVGEPVFGEEFSLHQVYVPLRGYYELEPEDSDRADELAELAREERPERRIVVDLASEIDAWIDQPRGQPAIRVIRGGPGSGKSSFAKMYAAHRAAQGGVRVLYVPLHLLDIRGDLVSAVGKLVASAGWLDGNPLNAAEGGGRLLIVFDGLDELEMQGKLGSEAAVQFIREVERYLAPVNQGHWTRVQVLLTGRDVVVQANEGEFRKPGQVLHVLPYLVAQDPDNQSVEWVDPRKLLHDDQRQVWWRKYGLTTGSGFEAMPRELAREDLDEITTEPLLNYLVALSFTRGRLDFSKEVNLNQIYADLLDAVYERGYEEGRRHPSIRNLKREQFIRVLEEIGLAAWHGDGRTTTVSAIRHHCKHAGVENLLNAFQEGAEAGVTSLLAAFYFRQHGESSKGDRTFEFTHKSFGEYLTARRIVRGLKKMDRDLQRHREDPDDGYDERGALAEWATLCGPTQQDAYLMAFLRGEVTLQPPGTISQWQKMLGNLIGQVLRHGMPLERLEPRPDYQEEERQSRNAEEALLVLLHACALCTRERSQIPWPEPTSAGTWLRRLQGQRAILEPPPVLQCLEWLDLSRQVLFGMDLVEAQLRQVDLCRADIGFVTFYRASLAQAHLEEAVASAAMLQDADLQDADLQNADLEEANLQWANLQEANLQEANLHGAFLRHANLQEANLPHERLQEADLQRAAYSGDTRFHDGFDPKAHGMICVEFHTSGELS